MAKPMYVTLDALIPSDRGGSAEEETMLVKRVSEDYKGKTFGELLQKVVDGSADEFNEQAYNAQENQVASYVSELLRQANTNPGEVQLFALSKDTPPQEIHVGLNDKVSDYSDRILKIETIEGTGGEEQRYQKIQLTISDNTSGGYM